MTPTQTLRTNAAKANDLFARMAATTPGAIKTRQGLFAELKLELELHAALEHDHLLPVLKKHPETKEMAPQIADRLRSLRTLLARMEKEPVESDEFIGKVVELKRLFQLHVRDEKNELLPALQKALSKDEAAALAEKMALQQAAADKVKQDEDDRKRAEVKAERERLVAQAAADKLNQEDERKRAAAKAERERLIAQAAADKLKQEDARKRAEAKAERERSAAQEAAEQARESARLAEVKAAQRTARAAKAAAKAERDEAELASHELEKVVRSAAQVVQSPVSHTTDSARQAAPTADLAGSRMVSLMSDSLRQYASAWSGYTRARFNNRMAAWGSLHQCRTPGDLFALQARLVRDEVETLQATHAELAAMATRTMADASGRSRG